MPQDNNNGLFDEAAIQDEEQVQLDENGEPVEASSGDSQSKSQSDQEGGQGQNNEPALPDDGAPTIQVDENGEPTDGGGSEGNDELDQELSDFKGGGDGVHTNDEGEIDPADPTGEDSGQVEKNENAIGSGEEEKKEEGSTEKQEEKEPSSDEESSSSAPDEALGAFVSALHKEGSLSSTKITDENGNERDIQSYEDLKYAIENEVSNKFEQHKQELDEDLKDLAEAKEKGVPLEEVKQYKSNEIFYRNISEDQIQENEKAQKNLVWTDHYQAFLERGLDQDTAKQRANSAVEKSENNESLFEDAKQSLQSLQQSEKQKYDKAVEESEKEQERIRKQRKEQYERLENEMKQNGSPIKGLELTEKERDRVLQYAQEPVDYDENGRGISKIEQVRKEDPVEFEKRLLTLIEKGFFSKDADASQVKQEAKSEAAKEFEQKVKSKGDGKSGKPKSSPSAKNSEEDDPNKIAENLPL